MAEKHDPKIWGLARASELGAALRGVRFAVTTQGSDLTYTGGINPPFVPEGRALDGLTDEDLFPEDGGRDLKELKARVHSTGEGGSIDFPFGHNGSTVWYRVWAEPTRANGEAGGLVTASVEITEQKRAEEHLRLALLELAHRSKNLLSVVLSIARQSVDESESLSDFSARFLGRIRSLGLAHDVLTDESWRGATLFSLVHSQVAALSDRAAAQTTIDGHNAYLKPNAVQYVGLALHELVATSTLSGALSTTDGRVVVTSLLNADGKPGSRLVLRWQELGTPQAPFAAKTRFAQALLTDLIPAALNGTAKIDESNANEFVYELSVPSSQFL